MKHQNPVALFSLNSSQEPIPVKDVVRIEASGSYSILILDNNKKIMSCKNLSQVEAPFLENGFFRIHKSHIINPVHIDHYSRSGLVVMRDGASVPVARRRKVEFKLKVLAQQEKRLAMYS